MTELESAVGRFIAAHTPLRPSDRIVAGLSGGADSVAMLLILTRLGYDVTAIHCNFGLRGAESDRDEAFSRDLAARLGVEFEVARFDVAAYRKAHGVSTEMACRELRYARFARRRAELGAAAIAVAHHREDNVETFFLNLLRGSSINGLGGMEPFDVRTSVVRPLLDSTRAQIESYLAESGTGYVTDSSNASVDYQRNRLRNIVLPALRGQFPDADGRIARSIGMVRDNRDFYRRAVAEAVAPFLTAGGGIDVRSLSREPQAALILFEHLRGEGVSYTLGSEIIAAAGESGKRFGEFILDHGTLRKSDATRTPCRDDIELFAAPAEALDPKAAPECAYFDISLLDHAGRIEVRPWRRGDRIKPWGAKGSKKLSDLFSDAGVAVDRKDSIPVVLLDGEVLWVAGLRASRLFPIAPGSTEIAVMRLRR